MSLPIRIDTGLTPLQQFGYAPGHALNIPSFDLANRPLFRSRTESQHVTRVATTLGDDGGWVSTSLLETVREAYPTFQETVNAGGYVSERIEVDDRGRAYTLLEIRLRSGDLYNVLLYSRDNCRTWQLVTLPFGGARPIYDDRDNGTAALEQYAGWNHSERPPLVAVWRPISDWPGSRASLNELYVLRPYFSGSGLVLPPPTLVSSRYIGQTYGAGGASFAASTSSTSYVVWPEVAGSGDAGTPTYVCSFDHATRRVGEPQKLAQALPRNDDHDAPGIVCDGLGYLHVLTGAHNAPFFYAHSVRPLDVTAWTPVEQVLHGGYISDGDDPSGSARQTYLSLACLPDNSLVTVFRQARRGVDADFGGAYHDALCVQRRSPNGVWSESQPLVSCLDLPGYAIYHQKLTVDRFGRLYLSLSYFNPAVIPEAEREAHRYTHRMVLTSQDGGITWDFSSSAGLLSRVRSTSINVTAPTGTVSRAKGSALPVSWTTSVPVGTGQFSIWAVSPSNGWYVGKIVDATGASSYGDSVTLDVPAGAGYRIFVYYRAQSGDPWTIYGMSSGTVDVTAAGFDAIDVTAPAEPVSGAQGTSLPVTWTTDADVADGQFSIWVVSAANGWYGGKIVDADGTAAYEDSIDLNVPVEAGYRVFVFHRAAPGDPWGIYGMSSGTVDVTAAAFSSISVTTPAEPVSGAQGTSLPVAWMTDGEVAGGQFSLWVVSSGNGWYVGKIHDADGTAAYDDSIDLNVPVAASYRVFVFYRATPGDPWGIYDCSAGTVEVTAP